MNSVIINVFGRIPKYFFGVLRSDFREEIDGIVRCCGEDIEDEQTFLRKILSLVLEDNEEEKERFYSDVIDKEELSKFPKFEAFISEIMENNFDHFHLMSELFESGNRMFSFVNFFETDTKIKISIDDESLYEGRMIDFADALSGGNMEEDSDSECADTLRSLVNDNGDFGMDVEYSTWSNNSHGCLFANIDMWPKSMVPLVDSEYGVSIYMDDISEFSFCLDVEDFDIKKLTFVRFTSADEFRGLGGVDVAFNYVFYNNEPVIPDESWLRDKGITLFYNSEDSLDFLLNG